MKKIVLKLLLFFFLISICNSFSSEYRIKIIKEENTKGKQIRQLRLEVVTDKNSTSSNPVIILRKTNGTIIRTDDEGANWYPYNLLRSSDKSIIVYPNPANEILYTDVASIKNLYGNFEITDIFGNIVLNCSTVNIGINSIDINKLSKGVYILKYVTDSEIHTAKFFKQ